MGQNGILVPSSWLMASARAVLPVPGPPASKTPRPAILWALMRSTTTPHAYESQCKGQSRIPIQMAWPCHTSYLARCLLTHEPCSLLVGGARKRQTQAFDVGVRRGAIVATLVFDLAYLNHLAREISGNGFGRRMRWRDAEMKEAEVPSSHKRKEIGSGTSLFAMLAMQAMQKASEAGSV